MYIILRSFKLKLYPEINSQLEYLMFHTVVFSEKIFAVVCWHLQMLTYRLRIPLFSNLIEAFATNKHCIRYVYCF